MKKIFAKRGFTLIEMLVVVGIIGILSAILLRAVGGGTEAARGAKCMANLRALALAANAAAMEGRWYPVAGSAQYGELKSDGEIYYYEYVGWISWLSSNHGDPFGKYSGNPPRNPPKIQVCEFNTENDKDAMFAITNGTIWHAVNRNISVYTCPSHVDYCRKKYKVIPHWSYVMNARFGYDSSHGEGDAPILGMRWEYAKFPRADRTLMFAELPTEQADATAKGKDKWTRDCTLQYKASVNGASYNKGWGGTPESIGFNHKSNKDRRCGHVAFADGHVEKILEPEGKGSLNAQQLTALLCEGRDISYGGKGYQEVREND